MKYILTADEKLIREIVEEALNAYALDTLASDIIQDEMDDPWGNPAHNDFFHCCIDAMAEGNEEEVGALLDEAEGDTYKQFLMRAVVDAGLLLTIRALVREEIPFTLKAHED